MELGEIVKDCAIGVAIGAATIPPVVMYIRSKYFARKRHNDKVERDTYVNFSYIMADHINRQQMEESDRIMNMELIESQEKRSDSGTGKKG